MADEPFFRIERVTNHCFAALARPVARVNCNAAIVVTSEWILVVDTHSRPSAARALVAQIRAEWPGVPIRYVVNTHFHWDHVQGNSAYTHAFGSTVELISTEATFELMRSERQKRLRDTVDSAESELTHLRCQESGDPSAESRLRGLERYCQEMKETDLPLPTRTFTENHVVRSRELTVHLLAPGRAHTAGDLIVYLPTEGVIVTGDLAQGIVPYLGDGYPDEWIAALDLLAGLKFDRIIPGHGTVQTGSWLLSFVHDYLRAASETAVNGLEEGTPLQAAEQSLIRVFTERSDWPMRRARILAEMKQIFGKSSDKLLDEALRGSFRDTWSYYSGVLRPFFTACGVVGEPVSS
jgi:cyclase